MSVVMASSETLPATIANPTAAILSAALMLDFLGEDGAADRIRAACAEPVTGSTTDVGDVIAGRVGN